MGVRRWHIEKSTVAEPSSAANAAAVTIGTTATDIASISLDGDNMDILVIADYHATKDATAGILDIILLEGTTEIARRRTSAAASAEASLSTHALRTKVSGSVTYKLQGVSSAGAATVAAGRGRITAVKLPTVTA